ncbi:MAG TPA: hypothetical protein VGF79_13460 [Bacteroidia bacterium]
MGDFTIKYLLPLFVVAVLVGYYIDYRKDKKYFLIQLKAAAGMVAFLILFIVRSLMKDFFDEYFYLSYPITYGASFFLVNHLLKLIAVRKPEKE